MWVLLGPEIQGSLWVKSEYVLYNDLRSVPSVGECSLIIRNITWVDQGDCICKHIQVWHNFVPEYKHWGFLGTKHIK